MENDTNNTNIIKTKLDKYMDAKIPVHIVFKLNNEQKKERREPKFFNGIILGKKSEDIYIIKELKFGETFFLIDEVYDVVVYTNDKGMKNERRKQI